MEYASPRPVDDGHLVTSEGGLDWVRGVEPCVGKVKDIKVLEQLATMLHRSLDAEEKNDYDYGGTSMYLKDPEKPFVDACVLRPHMAKAKTTRFLDLHYYHFSVYGARDCAFYEDGIYHIGKRLSIWLRHFFLQGWTDAAVDTWGWVSIADVIIDVYFWTDIRGELF